jgi:photosystem II stability/assembly factor-like uncharacterized protein
MFMEKRRAVKTAAVCGFLLTAAVWLLGQGWVTAARSERDPVQTLAISRDGAVWVGTKRGLFQTTLSGDRRITVFKGGVRQILIDPGNQALIHALGEGSRLHQSRDGGRTWQPAAGQGLPNTAIRALAYDPSGPTRLVALVEGEGYYQSESGGATWRRMGRQDIPGATALAINPLDARTVLVGSGEGLHQSTNQGVRFELVPPSLPWRLKAAVHSLTVTADRSAIWAATADGIFRTADGGRSWLPLGRPDLPDVTAVAVDPWRPHIAAAGSSSGEIAISRDGGATWQSIR